jgi:hypothetical protein
MDVCAVAGCFPADRFGNLGHGRTAEIGQVHRNLRQSADQYAHSLDVTKTARRIAHPPRDFLGDAHVGRGQVNVVGNQGFPRADDSRAGAA